MYFLWHSMPIRSCIQGTPISCSHSVPRSSDTSLDEASNQEVSQAGPNMCNANLSMSPPCLSCPDHEEYPLISCADPCKSYTDTGIATDTWKHLKTVCPKWRIYSRKYPIISHPYRLQWLIVSTASSRSQYSRRQRGRVAAVADTEQLFPNDIDASILIVHLPVPPRFPPDHRYRLL